MVKLCNFFVIRIHIIKIYYFILNIYYNNDENHLRMCYYCLAIFFIFLID